MKPLKFFLSAGIFLILCFLANLCFVAVGSVSDSKTVSDQKGKRAESRRVQLKGGQVVVGPNIQIHPNPAMQQHETSIVTHPSSPDTVLAAAITMDTAGFASGWHIGWYYTTDGGVTWTGGDTLPTHTDLTQLMADPTVGIDLSGNLFVNGLISPPPPTPPARDVILARSTDGGVNWSQTTVINPDDADKMHMAIDINAGSPFQGYIYEAYTAFGVGSGNIRFQRSTDGGQVFSAPINIGRLGGFGFGVNLTVSADSELYATWGGFNSFVENIQSVKLGFNKSSNGGTSWGTEQEIRTITNIGTLTKGGSTIRATSIPSMAVDRSAGPRRGWIYIVYAARNPTRPDIFLIRSTDGGVSWSSPVIVNQDNSGKDQWQTWISVDPLTGMLFVVYYDSRNFSANDSAEVYVSASLDGGETFEDILVSDAPFLPAPLRGHFFSTYMGSYIGITALNGTIWPCWNDNRTGTHQAYTSKITFIEIGQPKISVLPDSLDFGDVIINQAETLTVNVRNLGYPDTLEVSNISSDTSVFTPELANFSLPGASSQPVKVTFNPSLPSAGGLVSATLTITSSDTSNPSDTVPLLGCVLVIVGDLALPLNGNRTPADVVTLINTVFKSKPLPVGVNPCSADVNKSSGPPSPADVVTLINNVFKNRPLPAGNTCGC